MALVGQGVELGNAQEELKTFLEKADIPAGRTLMGLSALPSNHPLNMGMLGMHGSYSVNLKEQEADVLIAIGMRFSDRVTGNLERYAKQAKIIHLDIDRSEIDKCVKTTVSVVGDCKVTLPALTALVNKSAIVVMISLLIKQKEEKICNNTAAASPRRIKFFTEKFLPAARRRAARESGWPGGSAAGAPARSRSP